MIGTRSAVPRGNGLHHQVIRLEIARIEYHILRMQYLFFLSTSRVASYADFIIHVCFV